MWKESGKKPAALARRPKLKQEDVYYYASFMELSRSRGSGEAFGPIPISEFVAYFQLWRIENQSERYRFLRVVSALDQEFVTLVNEKRKKELDKVKAGSGKKGSTGRP
jgi:hypothetical protein